MLSTSWMRRCFGRLTPELYRRQACLFVLTIISSCSLCSFLRWMA
jgi:hypothetical protein